MIQGNLAEILHIGGIIMVALALIVPTYAIGRSHGYVKRSEIIAGEWEKIREYSNEAHYRLMEAQSILEKFKLGIPLDSDGKEGY